MPTQTPTQTREERPIHECVFPDDLDHVSGKPTWKNQYKNARVTPAIPEPFNPGKSSVNYFEVPIEERDGHIVVAHSSPLCAALDTKAGLLTQGLRQEPVRVHSTSTSPKNPTTVNIFGPKYH
jgi:hypothetical protein